MEWNFFLFASRANILTFLICTWLYKNPIFMQLFTLLFWGVFGIINLRIITSDISKKIIPNKLLVWLCILSCIWYISEILSLWNITYFLSLFVLLCTSVSLYSFWLFSAGDAKYILVLFLFLPQTNLLLFLACIWLITLLYILGFIIYKCCIFGIFYQKTEPSYIWYLINDILYRVRRYKNSLKENYFLIFHSFKHINLFLLVFITLRLSRAYIIDNIIIISKVNDYYMYFLALFGLIFVTITYFWLHIYKKIVRVYPKANIYILSSFHMFLFLTLSVLLYQGYRTDSWVLFENISLIFTLYLGIYLFIRGVIYLYRFFLIHLEARKIHYTNIQVGDTIKMDFLTSYILKIVEREKYPQLNENDIKTLKSIRNNLTLDQITVLKKLYETKKIGNSIEVLPSFSFGVFILTGYMWVILYWEYFLHKIKLFFYYLI